MSNGMLDQPCSSNSLRGSTTSDKARNSRVDAFASARVLSEEDLKTYYGDDTDTVTSTILSESYSSESNEQESTTNKKKSKWWRIFAFPFKKKKRSKVFKHTPPSLSSITVTDQSHVVDQNWLHFNPSEVVSAPLVADVEGIANDKKIHSVSHLDSTHHDHRKMTKSSKATVRSQKANEIPPNVFEKRTSIHVANNNQDLALTKTLKSFNEKEDIKKILAELDGQSSDEFESSLPEQTPVSGSLLNLSNSEPLTISEVPVTQNTPIPTRRSGRKSFSSANEEASEDGKKDKIGFDRSLEKKQNKEKPASGAPDDRKRKDAVSSSSSKQNSGPSQDLTIAFSPTSEGMPTPRQEQQPTPALRKSSQFFSPNAGDLADVSAADSTPFRIKHPTPQPRKKRYTKGRKRTLSSPPPMMTLPKNVNEAVNRGNARYVVAEILYHGRSLTIDEKGLIRSKLAQLVDSILTKDQASNFDRKGDNPRQHVGEMRDPARVDSVILRQSLAEEPTVVPSSKKELHAEVDLREKGVKIIPQSRTSHVKQSSAQGYPSDRRKTPIAAYGNRPNNMKRLVHHPNNSLAYDNTDVSFTLLQSHDQTDGSSRSLPRQDADGVQKRFDPRRSASRSEKRSRGEETDSAARRDQAANHSESRSLKTLYSNDAPMDNSLSELMNFMNSSNRSPSVTSQPRHYKRQQKQETPLTSNRPPSCANLINDSRRSFPRFDAWESNACSSISNVRRPAYEFFDASDQLPPTNPQNLSLRLLGRPDERTKQDTETLTSTPGSNCGNKCRLPSTSAESLPQSTPQTVKATPTSSTQIQRRWRQSATETPTEHDAWWMPREWARERGIGAYAKTRHFNELDALEREQAVQLSKNANVEKIRMCNFIKL
ncbi:uncharacterized protein LOC143471311 isoform X1 [Clavelina lepadiformis]|uniref:uncharacterized protein LOC143471311 isoform X1 n=1 Tax=Clavelina lepadiformis TaxID=159417 RepID=UPI0040424A09